ncbi:hypothetical protein C1H46_045152 [Malus baccata]|nr:hypothetical protein C1H46_045152 [Malus baccata]
MASFDAFSMDGDDLHAPNSHFDQDDVVVESYADYGSYTDHGAAAPASPDVFGFEDPSPNYSHSTPFDSVPVENGNGNGYGVDENGIDDGVFTSDGPVLPEPSEFVEEGSALREWRR